MHRIALVEDDFDMAEILSECLGSDPDLEIVEVIHTEEDARDRFYGGLLHLIDVVFMDLQLVRGKHDSTVNPHAGIELIEELRKVHNFRGTIIVLTNSNDSADGQRSMRAGCDGYLCKHLRMSDLPALLTELRLAIRGDVLLMPKEMKHMFFRPLPDAPPEYTAGI